MDYALAIQQKIGIKQSYLAENGPLMLLANVYRKQNRNAEATELIQRAKSKS